MATAMDGSFAISWNPTVNGSFSAFARGFDSTGTSKKNDFRVDLNGRAAAGATRVARTAQAKKFVFAWRDNRAGHFDMYTRAVQALP